MEGGPAGPQPLPRGFGWLLRLVPEAAMFGEMVQRLIEDPEMAALLREAPHLGPILRSLCWMFAIRPGPELRLPPRRKRTSPVAPALKNEPPPDAPPVSPRAPSPGASPERPPPSPELAQVSDADLARRLAAARAGPPPIPDPDAPQPV